MATKSKGDLRDDIDQLRNDLHQLHQDFSKASGHVYEAGRDSANAAGEYARESADTAAQHVRDCVHEHPFRSLLIAAGVGMVTGALFRWH